MTAMINTIKTIKANADLFIIPNAIVDTTDKFYDAPHYRKLRETGPGMSMLNGLNPMDPDSSKLVQVWITSKEDLHTENLGDHCFHVDDQIIAGHDGKYSAGYLPLSMLKGHHEGDHINIKMDYSNHGIMLELDCRLAQTEYRYRNFGTFEDCLSRISGWVTT